MYTGVVVTSMNNIEANICKTLKHLIFSPEIEFFHFLSSVESSQHTAIVANVFMDKVSMFNATADILALSLPNVACARQLK